MGTRNLVMLKTHIDSINLSFANGFVKNLLWALASLWIFFSNYVLYSLGLILRYIFRFCIEDRKSDHFVPHDLLDQTKRNHIEDSKVDEFAEELAKLLFPELENFHAAIEEREGETECPDLLEIDSDINIYQDAKSLEGETDCSVLKEEYSAMHEGAKKSERETECSVLKEKYSDMQEGAKKLEGETECSVLKEENSDMHEVGKKRESETERSVSMETVSCFNEDVNKIGENETESSVFTEGDSSFPQDNRKIVEEKTEESFFADTDSGKASDLIEEPRIMTFTFQQNYIAANVYEHLSSSTKNIANKEISENNLEESLVDQEEKDHSVQEQRNITSNSTSGQIIQSDAFVGSDSSHDDDDVIHDNTFLSDFESESCSSNINDSVTHQILSTNHSSEGFDSESLEGNKDESVQDREETQYSCDINVSGSLNLHLDGDKEEMKDSSYYREEANMEKSEENMWDDNFDESDFDEEEEEDDFEWEHDEVVEQLRMELKNARQGGLATILEEEEEQEEEEESPKVVVVEDLKPLKIEEKKIEYKDHIVEIQKVYRCYAEKIRKLDVLNYQTMNAIGLLQLKDPLKLMLIPKSSVQIAKPLISQNLWPRKALKQISDSTLKFVDELHRELELVYVGQVCLSWEILCWQHNKVQDLKQYDSKWPRSYNLVAGEFQLFHVLMQRFLEDEPFQGPRIQNYVNNRCVIRNLLQVPAIKDDNTKDKKLIKMGEEYAIDSESLAHIIRESMRMFWEFVRADKDYGSVNLKVSHQTGIDMKDPAISDLLRNVRTQLQKKERKLKDIVRSGNCIVRKFKRHNVDQIELDQEQLLAQVGLRLVSRVVQVKKLSKDQLMWCDEKLKRIKFVGRKVQVEPYFSFFPC